MPAPCMIVTFTDADGDDFPVRVPGDYSPTGPERGAVVKAARAEAQRMIDAGEWRPTLPLKLHGVMRAGA